MSKSLWSLSSLVLLATGLAGCISSAGVSTWEYQSGPGFSMERVYEGRVSADTEQGLTREACTSVSRRQMGVSGGVSGSETVTCDPD
jgi:hypothetical protein